MQRESMAITTTEIKSIHNYGDVADDDEALNNLIVIQFNWEPGETR